MEDDEETFSNEQDEDEYIDDWYEEGKEDVNNQHNKNQLN